MSLQVISSNCTTHEWVSAFAVTRGWEGWMAMYVAWKCARWTQNAKGGKLIPTLLLQCGTINFLAIESILMAESVY